MCEWLIRTCLIFACSWAERKKPRQPASMVMVSLTTVDDVNWKCSGPPPTVVEGIKTIFTARVPCGEPWERPDPLQQVGPFASKFAEPHHLQWALPLDLYHVRLTASDVGDPAPCLAT